MRIRKKAEKPSPFNPDGTLKPKAFNNILVALLIRAGGSVELPYPEMDASNNREFFYRPNETGLEVTLIDPHHKGTA